jgi:hypothetical protein
VISSKLTTFYIFLPVLWSGLFGLFTAWMFLGDRPGKWMFLPGWILGTTYLAWVCFPLKHVTIDGSDLLISTIARTSRVPLSYVCDVTRSIGHRMDRVWIHFHRATECGEKIVFLAPVRMFAVFPGPHPIVAELKELAARHGGCQPCPPPLPCGPRTSGSEVERGRPTRL